MFIIGRKPPPQPALMKDGGTTWENTNLLIQFMHEQEGFEGYVRLRRCMCLFGFRDDECLQMAINNMDMNGAVQVVREEDEDGDGEADEETDDEEEPDE